MLLIMHCLSCLGVCLGMQIAVIEFARNVLGLKDANSTEFDPSTTNPVVIEMPEHNPGKMGGTMRLGKRKTIFKTSDSLLSKLSHNALFTCHQAMYSTCKNSFLSPR